MRKTSKVKNKQSCSTLSELSDTASQRLLKVYNTLRDVIEYDGKPLILEKFEVMIMQDKEPELALSLWETIEKAYAKSCRYFGDDIESKRDIYKWILFIAMDQVSEEEKCLPEVEIIIRCFNSVKS